MTTDTRDLMISESTKQKILNLIKMEHPSFFVLCLRSINDITDITINISDTNLAFFIISCMEFIMLKLFYYQDAFENERRLSKQLFSFTWKQLCNKQQKYFLYFEYLQPITTTFDIFVFLRLLFIL